jgi:hypothetical protein
MVDLVDQQKQPYLLLCETIRSYGAASTFTARGFWIWGAGRKAKRRSIRMCSKMGASKEPVTTYRTQNNTPPSAVPTMPVIP